MGIAGLGAPTSGSVKESAKSPSKTVAKQAEQARRRELEKGFNGISDERQERIQSVQEFGVGSLADYRVRQPRSAAFAQHALGHVLRLLGDRMAVDMKREIRGEVSDRSAERGRSAQNDQ